MENKITDLIENALKCEDYELRINFLVGGLMSYESNDTADKEHQSTLYLKEILNYIENKAENEVKDDKFNFLMHLKDNVKKYLEIDYKLKSEGMVKDMTDIEILMEDGCTREDAQRHLEVGTIVFDDFEDHLDSYCAELAKGDEEFEEELRKMVETKEPAPDCGIVELSGKTYYIMYCL